MFLEKLELGQKLMNNKQLVAPDEDSDSEMEPMDEVFISNLPKRCDYYELKEF